MKYDRIAQELINEGYLDDRKIFCHSNNSYRTSSLFSKTVSSTLSLPFYFIASIKDEYLHISTCSFSGEYLNHHSSIKLENMRFVTEKTVNFFTHVFQFEGYSEDYSFEFYLITPKKANAKKIVEEVKKYELR